MKITFFFSLLFVFFLVLSPQAIAQGTYDQPSIRDSVEVRVITKKQGTYQGILIENTVEKVVLRNTLGKISLAWKDIKMLEYLDKDLKDQDFQFAYSQPISGRNSSEKKGKAIFSPLDSTRQNKNKHFYFNKRNDMVSPEGHVSYSNINLLFNQVDIGLGNHFSVSAGILPLAFLSIPAWVNLRGRIPIIDGLLAAGVSIFGSADLNGALAGAVSPFGFSGSALIVSGSLTLGNADNALTLGAGIDEGRLLSNVSFKSSVTDRLSVVLEAYRFRGLLFSSLGIDIAKDNMEFLTGFHLLYLPRNEWVSPILPWPFIGFRFNFPK